MSLLASPNPTLEEALQAFFDYRMADVHTCLPGTVTAFHAADQTVDVQPSLKRQYVGEAPLNIPIIEHVPLVFPSTSLGHLRFPVGAGDEVMLLFAERSIDEWFDKGGQVSPAAVHRFAITDAIAVPGLHAKPNAITPAGAADSAELVYAGGRVEITATGKFKVTNAGGQDLLAILGSLITMLKTAPQTDGSIFNPATVAALAVLETELATLKA